MLFSGFLQVLNFMLKKVLNGISKDSKYREFCTFECKTWGIKPLEKNIKLSSYSVFILAPK